MIEIGELSFSWAWILWTIIGLIGLIVFWKTTVGSYKNIRENQFGLVIKRFWFKRLKEGEIIAFNGEAGYQARLLMPGPHFIFSWIYKVEIHDYVQVPPGSIGVIYAQIGQTLPAGRKVAESTSETTDYYDLAKFAESGYQGIQSQPLPPGFLGPIHPVAFLVRVGNEIYGKPITKEIAASMLDDENISGRVGFTPYNFSPPQKDRDGITRDKMLVMYIKDGPPNPEGAIASRPGGFADIVQIEKQIDSKAENPLTGKPYCETDIVEALSRNNVEKHNAFQDFKAFLNSGGNAGLQYYTLPYGQYLLNPYLHDVEIVDQIEIHASEVGVVTQIIGLPSEDISGTEFKHGTIVKPGHKGVWSAPLRAGKFALNPHIFQITKIPTCVITLSWVKGKTGTHMLDNSLEPITVTSMDGFALTIDLQVQIHISELNAPKLIWQIGSMQTLITDMLEPTVSNHFRIVAQRMKAIEFYQDKEKLQREALQMLETKLRIYDVECKDVCIQNVVGPPQLLALLNEREISNQSIETSKQQEQAAVARQSAELAKGRADVSAALGKKELEIQIAERDKQIRTQNAEATFIERTKQAEADKRITELTTDAQVYAVTKAAEAEASKLTQIGQGEASKIQSVGEAEGKKIAAIGTAEAANAKLLGEAKAAGFKAQVEALQGNGGQILSSILNTENIFKNKPVLVPQISLGGSGNGSDSLMQLILAKTLGANIPTIGAIPPEEAPKPSTSETNDSTSLLEVAKTASETAKKVKNQ